MEKFKPIKSTKKNKKYMVLTDKGIIHFGDTRFQNFRQHKDKVKQEAYCRRAKGIKNKNGKLTYKDKNSANYWSYHFTWKCK